MLDLFDRVLVLAAILLALGIATPAPAGEIGARGELASGIGCARALGADCNANGIEDSVDIAVGSSRDANWNAIPDECEEAFPARTDRAPQGAAGRAPRAFPAFTAARLPWDAESTLRALARTPPR
jgi:hypothetical protein